MSSKPLHTNESNTFDYGYVTQTYVSNTVLHPEHQAAAHTNVTSTSDDPSYDFRIQTTFNTHGADYNYISTQQSDDGLTLVHMNTRMPEPFIL